MKKNRNLFERGFFASTEMAKKGIPAEKERGGTISFRVLYYIEFMWFFSLTSRVFEVFSFPICWVRCKP